MSKCKRTWICILLGVCILLCGLNLFGRHQQAFVENTDFNEFINNNSSYFNIARSLIPWEQGIPSDATMSYLHKRINDGREYIEIKIAFTPQSCIIVHEYAEMQATLFAQNHVDRAPYFCIKEEPFQVGETIFQCYTFSVSESNQKPSEYYGYAIGYNNKENSVVYVLFSDEGLSYSEPDYLLPLFYP